MSTIKLIIEGELLLIEKKKISKENSVLVFAPIMK